MSEDAVVNAVVTELTARINECEVRSDDLRKVIDAQQKRLRELEGENHALKARLTAVALCIRP